jgi:hypothetical protein
MTRTTLPIPRQQSRPAVHHAQLRLGRRHEREADGGAEDAGAGVKFLWSRHSMM